MSLPSVRAVLLDVGGTLWPERISQNFDADVCARLGALLPHLDPAHTLHLVREVLKSDDGAASQATHACLARALGAQAAGLDPIEIRRALCVPAARGIELFPGARQLLADINALGLTTVIVSNVQVRGEEEYWRDFEHLGVARYIDAIVTSLDVGFRKPHPAMFHAALHAAGCAPQAAVMIGDSEVKDMEPALAMGMRAIRVAIEVARPQRSAAHGIVDRLDQVAGMLQSWLAPAQ